MTNLTAQEDAARPYTGAEPGTTEATLLRMDFAPSSAPAVGVVRGMTDITFRLQQSPSDEDVSWLPGSKPPGA